MANWIANDFLSFLIALTVTGLIIPQILLIAFRKNLFDEINERKIHSGVVPRLGGISFLPSILFSMGLVIGVNIKLFGVDSTTYFHSAAIPLCFMVCAVLLLFLVGLVDDLTGVKYMAKFMVQIIASILIVFSGDYINNLYEFFYIESLPEWIGWILTSMVVVGVVNAVNLIDGIDGLASGICIMAFVFYGIVFFASGEYLYSMLAWASAGTLLPFFYFNVFGSVQKKNKIFMGDAGALTIGLIVVFLGISVLNIREQSFIREYNPVVLALSPLIIPCFDVVRVYLHRISRHRNPFLPDKCHIHHKLLAMGLNQRMALCIIMLWAILFVVVNVFLSRYVNPTWLILGDIAIWTLINMGLSRAINFRERKIGIKIYD